VIVSLLYFTAAKLGLMYAVVGNTVTLIWPPSGIALAVLLVSGYRSVPGIALGAFLANAWTGVPLLTVCGITIGNTLEALTGAFLLNRLARFHNSLDRLWDVFTLIVLAATCSTMVSAGIGVAAMALGGVIPLSDYGVVWLKWWMGDMMGMLVVAPPLLVWLSHPHIILSPLKIFEALGLVAALMVVSYAIFGVLELAGHGYYPAALAVFPFVIWGALRFGPWGATTVTLISSMLTIWGTTRGTGPFAVGLPVDSLVRLCAFTIIVSITGLLLGASSAERERARADLKRSRDELEQRVWECTWDLMQTNNDLYREMVERKRLETEVIRVSEEHQKTIGQELHDGLGQHLTGIAILSMTLQQRLCARSLPEAGAAQEIVELINQAISMTRSLARGLYPAALESSGLTAALEQLADYTTSVIGIECALRCDPQVRVNDKLVAINLYRIAQEAVNNAVKYSKAKHIWLDFSIVDEKYRFSVSDDGIGFDPKVLGPCEGMGLHSMRYRASLLGGSLDIRENPKGGTMVAVIYAWDQGGGEVACNQGV
jgi:two-component system, NarL family, sensor histidine kinase FusK